MITIQTRKHRNGIPDSLKLTHFPESIESEVRKFLNSKGMKEVLYYEIPQKVTEYKFIK